LCQQQKQENSLGNALDNNREVSKLRTENWISEVSFHQSTHNLLQKLQQIIEHFQLSANKYSQASIL
jgi:hypothetical protein